MKRKGSKAKLGKMTASKYDTGKMTRKPGGKK